MRAEVAAGEGWERGAGTYLGQGWERAALRRGGSTAAHPGYIPACAPPPAHGLHPPNCPAPALISCFYIRFSETAGKPKAAVLREGSATSERGNEEPRGFRGGVRKGHGRQPLPGPGGFPGHQEWHWEGIGALRGARTINNLKNRNFQFPRSC